MSCVPSDRVVSDIKARMSSFCLDDGIKSGFDP